MTNATDELRRLLDERGVEWADGDASYTTEWTNANGQRCSAMYWKPTFSVLISDCTPEQAIAATLGKLNATSNQESIVRSFLRKISPNRDWDYLGEHEHALIADLVDAIAATVGNGTLAAEQVMKIAGKHQPDYCSDTHVCFNWQAIADELNATLDSGECELAEVDSYSNANEVIHVLECSACGETCEHVNGSYPKCPHCGKAVKS